MIDIDRYRRCGPLLLVAFVVGASLLLSRHGVAMPMILAVATGLSLAAGAGYVALGYHRRGVGRATVSGSSPRGESEQRFRGLLESLPKVAVQGYDKQRRVIYWNEASEALYGYGVDEAIGRPLEELLIPASMREAVIAAHHAWIEEGVAIPAGELELKHRSGAPVTVFSYHVMLGERSDNPLMFCVDVDLRELAQARREYDLVTGFDTLSQLPDRSAFGAELTACLVDCRRRGERLAVIGIDIDPGDDSGATLHGDATQRIHADALMATLASRLRHAHQAYPLTRSGEAGFLMILPGLHSDEEILPLLESIFDDLRRPVVLGDREWRIAASLGIGLFPDNGLDADELIRNAEAARQRARLAGPNSYWFFDRRLHDELTRQQRIMQRLWQDLRDGEFVLRYRPRMAATDERIEGLEALLHYAPREGRAESPIDILPANERSELLHRLGDWVMREACRKQPTWRDSPPGDYRVDIRVPDGQLSPDATLEPLEAYMAESRLSPRLERWRDGDSGGPDERRGREYAIRLEAEPAPHDD